MPKCPQCGNELIPDPRNVGKVLCNNCKKRFSEDAVNAYWSRQGAQQGAPQQAYPQQPPMPQQAPQQAPQVSQSQPAGVQPGVPINIGGNVPPQMPNNGNGMPSMPNGQASQPMYQGYNQPLPKGGAIAALILGILALLGCWMPLLNVVCIIMGVIAIILGVRNIKKVGRGMASGKGLSIAGIVTSGIAIVLSIGITGCTMSLAGDVYDEIMNGNVNVVIDEYDLEPNGANIDSILDDTNSNAGDATSSTGGSLADMVDVAPVAGMPWSDFTFQIDGKAFTLGKSTLGDFCTQTGWKVDGADGDVTVSANSSVSTIELVNPVYEKSTTVYVSVSNPSSHTVKLGDALLTSFDISYYNSADKVIPTFTIADDVKLGATSMADAKAKYGTPTETSTTSDYDSCGYEDEDYTHLLDLASYSGDNGIISSIRMKLFL